MFFGVFPNLDSSSNLKLSGPKWKVPKETDTAGGKLFKNKALSKTLKFRAVTLVTTLGITWLLTGNPVTSVGLTVLQQSTNTAVYYFFEKNEKKRYKQIPSS